MSAQESGELAALPALPSREGEGSDTPTQYGHDSLIHSILKEIGSERFSHEKRRACGQAFDDVRAVQAVIA